MFESSLKGKAQIALEFLIVYSFILIVFVLLFAIVTTQRTVGLVQQEQSLMQLQAQNIATYINQAAIAGDGYSATLPLINTVPNYNISISTTGVVIVQAKVGSQILTAYGFGNAGGLIIAGTKISPNIYKVQTAQGNIRMLNFKGTVYIDSSPAVDYGFFGPYVTQLSNVRVATFNDTSNTEIILPQSQTLTLGSNFAISFWFLANPVRQGCGTLIGNNAASQGKFTIYLAHPGSVCSSGAFFQTGSLIFNYGSGNIKFTSASFPTQTWMHAVAVYNGAASQMTWYINGTAGAPNVIVTGLTTDANTFYIGGGASFFNGSIADVQVYNGILTARQVQTLYNSGIAGGPVGSNIVGWWPLNGNLNDYSGYNDQGLYTNATWGAQKGTGFSAVISQAAQFIDFNGRFLPNKIAGVETNLGVLGSSGSSFVASTNSNGIIDYFITENGTLSTHQTPIGPGIVAIDYFQGPSQPINLVGWWPFDLGTITNIQNPPAASSYTVYDLSGSYDNGNFTGFWQIVKPTSTTPLISALFPGNPANVLSGGAQEGFITVNSASSLLNTARNNSFTVVAWIRSAAIGTALHSQGIFGNWNGVVGGGGFQLEGYSRCPNSFGSCVDVPVLEVAGDPVNFPLGSLQSFPLSSTWKMVAAEYNGTTGLATVYLNNTTFASNMLPKNLQLTQQSQPASMYYIGDDASQPTGLDTFNGSIANIQLYSAYLNPQQINNLYSSGISSVPLGNSGLISWWPLANNTRDYSYNNNNGAVNYNVLFANSTFNTYAGQNETFAYATFNGAYTSNILIPYNSELGLNSGFSVQLQFMSFESSSNSVNFDLFNSTIVKSAGGQDDTLDIRLCGTGSGCGVGLNGSIGSGGGWLSTSMPYKFRFNSYHWYKITETFNSTTWSIYQDTKRVAHGSTGGSPVLMNPGDYIRIGGGAKNSNTLYGQVFDMRIYKSCLTPAQVASIQQDGPTQHSAYNISVG